MLTTGGRALFPVMHAAALDRSRIFCSADGGDGPYSHVAFPGPGQIGLATMTADGGDTASVTLRSITLSRRDELNNVIVEDSFDFPCCEGGRLYLPAVVKT